MSHSGNEQLKEDAFEEVKQQYINQGYTEELAEALALKFAEDNPDFWHGEEPLSYDGYELEDLSDMDREEPCI
tara:strand:+ start:83 stop:301 length:219 start_codon:yes stop_codon:yes gene_type:complete